MTSRAITRTAGVCGLLLLLAACGGSSGGSSTGAQPTGAPTNGGTLKLLGSGDVDHLDPASAYYTVSYTLERAFTRQLVSYPASSDITTRYRRVSAPRRNSSTVPSATFLPRLRITTSSHRFSTSSS